MKVMRHLTYSNVMATVAVFLALGGGAYAAIKLPRNSVGAPQLRADAVTSKKVKNGSLLPADFAAGTLPKAVPTFVGVPGAQGAAGPKGDTGAPGPPGEPGAPAAPGSRVMTGLMSAITNPISIAGVCTHIGTIGIVPPSGQQQGAVHLEATLKVNLRHINGTADEIRFFITPDGDLCGDETYALATWRLPAALPEDVAYKSTISVRWIHVRNTDWPSGTNYYVSAVMVSGQDSADVVLGGVGSAVFVPYLG